MVNTLIALTCLIGYVLWIISGLVRMIEGSACVAEER